MLIDSFWLIICGAGAIQSLFLFIYFMNSKKIERIERVLLGTLFLAITLRLVKSIGWFFFDIEHMGFLNMGFVAHGFIGPLLAVYLLKKANKQMYSLLVHILIFIPPLILLGISPFIDLTNFWYVGGYRALLYGTILYLVWGAYLIWKIKKTGRSNFPWIRNLYLGILLFCLSYFTNYILGLNPYITGPIIYSLVIYFISFVVFSNHDLFDDRSEKKKYKNINLTEDQIEKHREKVEEVMKVEKLFLDSDFNLSVLSGKTNIPKHMLSKFFSESLNQNFTDYTNGYRIEEAKKMLLDEKHKNHKIAFIAYECGFNSLSSFNSAFKKKVKVSPSTYRSQELAGN